MSRRIIGCFDGTTLINFLERAEKNKHRVEVYITPTATRFSAVYVEPSWAPSISIQHSSGELDWPSYIHPWSHEVEEKIQAERKKAVAALCRAEKIAQKEMDRMMKNIDGIGRVEK